MTIGIVKNDLAVRVIPEKMEEELMTYLEKKVAIEKTNMWIIKHH